MSDKGKLTKTSSLLDFLIKVGANTIDVFEMKNTEGNTVRFFKVPGTDESGLISRKIQEDLDADKHVISLWMRPDAEPALLIHNKPVGGPATLVTSYSKE
jgi:hypothetical protein|tara:strand:- start:348 stop:647 length:300 start_codon:yes stop_codon:yes gene_type:complete